MFPESSWNCQNIMYTDQYFHLNLHLESAYLMVVDVHVLRVGARLYLSVIM